MKSPILANSLRSTQEKRRLNFGKSPLPMINISTTEELLRLSNIKRDTIYENIVVCKFEEFIDMDPSIMESHQKDFFEVNINREDKGMFYHRHKSYTNLSYSLSFMSPNQIFKYVPSEEGNEEGIIIFFKPSVFHPTKQNYDISSIYPLFKLHANPVYRLSPEQVNTLYPLFEDIYNECLKNDPVSDKMIRAYLEIILQMGLRTVKQNSQLLYLNRHEEITYQFEELLSDNTSRIKKLTNYADALHISPAYLSECIKKTTGRTAKQIMVDYQIIKAKSMLNQSSITIKELAIQLGFDEVTNFTKFFKKNTGQTPTQFRKNPINKD
jgi:AraC-like DNA-binding protein